MQIIFTPKVHLGPDLLIVCVYENMCKADLLIRCTVVCIYENEKNICIVQLIVFLSCLNICPLYVSSVIMIVLAYFILET